MLIISLGFKGWRKPTCWIINLNTNLLLADIFWTKLNIDWNSLIFINFGLLDFISYFHLFSFLKFIFFSFLKIESFFFHLKLISIIFPGAFFRIMTLFRIAWLSLEVMVCDLDIALSCQMAEKAKVVVEGFIISSFDRMELASLNQNNFMVSVKQLFLHLFSLFIKYNRCH